MGAVPVGTLQGTMFSVIPDWTGYATDVPTRMHIMGAIGIVWVLVATPVLQRALTNGLMRYLGRISFGLYLTHMLVIGTFTCWLFVVLQPVLGYIPAFTVAFIASGGLMWLAAHYFTRWVDEPAIGLSSAFYRRFFPARWN